MFFSENELYLELLGIFKISRRQYSGNACPYRNYDSISIRLSGSGQFKTDSRTLSVKRGDIIYLPHTLQYSQSTNGETIIAIHFINYSHRPGNDIEIVSPENYDYFEQTIMTMYNEWKEKKQGYKYKCTSLLYALLYNLNCQLFDNTIYSINHDNQIKTAIKYIHSHFRSESISISKLADMCAFSETYFRKLFKKIYDLSPNQYIINLRLEYASQLLQSHLYTVSEVSEKAGFHDTKYFSRLFRKNFGCSPREYQAIIPEKTWK